MNEFIYFINEKYFHVFVEDKSAFSTISNGHVFSCKTCNMLFDVTEHETNSIGLFFKEKNYEIYLSLDKYDFDYIKEYVDILTCEQRLIKNLLE